LSNLKLVDFVYQTHSGGIRFFKSLPWNHT